MQNLFGRVSTDKRTKNMNGWAWGFGRDVRAAKDKAASRKIRIEMAERQKARLSTDNL